MDFYARAVEPSVDGGLKLLALDMPLPPTLNQSYKAVVAGGYTRLALTRTARFYKEALSLFVRSEINFRDITPDPRAEYTIWMFQILKRNSRDVDGNIKLVMDAVFDGLGVNDNRVFHISLNKEIVKGCDPCLKVVVEA